MKLKYYLRGLSVGIIFTAIIMGIVFSGNREHLTEEEIVERARLLGMVMEDEVLEKQEDNNVVKDEQQTPELDNDAQPEDNGEPANNDNDDAVEPNADASQNPEDTSQQNPEDASQENPTDTSSQMVAIEVFKGDYSDVISQRLYEAGLVEDAAEFNAYMMAQGADSTLMEGVHQIPIGATPDQIIEILGQKPAEN